MNPSSQCRTRPDRLVRKLRAMVQVIITSLLALVLAGSCSEATADYESLVNSHSPIAYWRLGEASGTTAVDETGNHNGTYQNGITLNQTGAIGGDADTAADFAGGSNDRIQVPSFDVNGSALTLMGWVDFDSIPNDPRIISKASGEAVSLHDMALFVTDGSRQLKTRIRIGGSTREVTSSSNAVPLGEWVFLAAVYDGSAITLYVNGTAVATANHSGSLSPRSANAIGIGNQPSGAGDRPIDGDLDEVAVFDKALSPGEIATLYAMGSTPSVPISELLFVRAGSSYTTEEQDRVTGFEGWGYTVTPIEDGDSQTNFDTALASSDVVYVSPSADGASLAYKLRTTKIGVVHEGVSSWDDNVGWTTSNGSNANTCTTMTVVDNTHSVSEHFSTGTVTIFNSSSGSNGSQVVAPIASGAKSLATNLCINAGNANLLVMEIGSELANTYDGNSTASGRRVRLPFGGFSVSNWSNLSNDGLTMVCSALEWASSDGLIAHWKLDESSGTTAEDSSGSGHDATLTGTQAWTTGKDGGGHESDYTAGTDDYFEAPSSSALNNVHESNYTVMAYFKPNSVPPGSGSNNNASYAILIKEGNHLGIHYNSSRQFQFDHLNAGSSWSGAEADSTTYAPGAFYHVAGVVNYDAGTIDIYVDGVLAGSDTFTPGSSPQDYGSARWRLGIASPGSSTWRWPADGVIDDARIYERALSADEISQHASADLVVHWKLDETSGTTATDSSDNSRDGTVSGSPSWEAPARRSTGLTFDTSDGDDRVTGPHLDVVGDKLTLAVWFKQDELLNESRLLMHSFGNAGAQQGWGLVVDDSGDVEFRINAGGTFYRFILPTAVQPGDWRHLVGVYDSGAMRIYLDGVLIGTDTHSVGGDLTALPSATLTVGDSPTGGRPFDGEIDDVRVYSNALSEQEIAEVYGLVGHWELNEASGTIAVDSTAYANDGTYQGGASSGAAGPPGSAYAAEFDGVSGSKIDLPSAAHDFSDGVSMVIWYRADSLSGTYTDFFSFSNGTGLVDDIWFGLDGGKLDLFLSDTADGTAFSGLIEDSGGSLGEWYHAVATIDPDGNATLYRNGVVVKTGYIGLPRDVVRTNNGIGETTFGHTIDGRLAGTRLYNRPLRAEEVADLYGLETGLIGHWKLTETSGTTAVDSGPSGANGTYESGVAVDQGGPYPGVTAPAFDGSNDHVELPAINATFSGGLTIAAWIQPDAALGSGQFYEILDLSNGSEEDQILFTYNGAAGLQLFLTDTADGSSIRTIEDNTGFTAGRWVHCVATIDSSGFGKIYRNGKVTKSGFFTSLPTSVSRSTATIGKSGFGDHFGGGLQDVRLYNYELSAEEISDIYGLVGHWKLDEPSGTVAADSSGVGADGTYVGNPTPGVEGTRSYATEFDGIDDRIQVPANAAHDAIEAVSMAAWVKFNSFGSVGGGIFCRGDVSQEVYGIRVRPDGKLTWENSYGSPEGATAPYKQFRSETLLTLDRWHHVAATWDGSNVRLYIDGQLDSTKALSGQLGMTAEQSSIGSDTPGGDEWFDGAMDDLVLYNRAMSAAELAEHYGLVGHWRMEETSGTTVADSSGAGNHGTLVGTPEWSSDAKEGFGGLELDGTNYVEIAGIPATGESVSIAGWAKLGEADTNGAELISLGNYFAIRLDDGYYGTSAFAYSGAGYEFTGIGYDHASSGWRHFAAVFDGDAMELRLYVDGVLRSTEPASGPVTLSGWGTNTRFGEHADGETNRSFTGLLDDLRVYNRAITPLEARALFFGRYVTGLRIVEWIEVPNP